MKVTLECVYCVQFAEHVDQLNRMMINYNQREREKITLVRKFHARHKVAIAATLEL